MENRWKKKIAQDRNKWRVAMTKPASQAEHNE